MNTGTPSPLTDPINKNDGGVDNTTSSHSRGWFIDDVFQTRQQRTKADVVLLSLDTGESWFAETVTCGVPMNFLMDTGASKSVMSHRKFMSIPETERPRLGKMNVKFQVANGEVIAALGGAHMAIDLYGHKFRLPIFLFNLVRSEERRVGKDGSEPCRSLWCP